MTHWLTLQEASEYLKLSRHTLYKYSQKGKIPAAKLGRQWRFDPEAIDNWVRRPKGAFPFLQGVLSDFTRELKAAYGRRFRRLLLYGSWARGEATPDSDVDLLVILSDYPDYWKELDRIHRMAYEVTFGRDRPIVLSAFPIREREYARLKAPLISVIQKESRQVA